MIIHITRDGEGAEYEYVWWPEHAELCFDEEDQAWWDVKCRCRGTPLGIAAIVFLLEALEITGLPYKGKLTVALNKL